MNQAQVIRLIKKVGFDVIVFEPNASTSLIVPPARVGVRASGADWGGLSRQCLFWESGKGVVLEVL